MLTLAQHTRRKQGIGASEVGAILGLSKYRTALDVYLDKLGLTPPSEDSEAAEWGHRLEGVIAQKYLDTHPGLLLDPCDTVAHPDHAWALATPDRLVVGPPGPKLLEIKTRESHTTDGFGEPGTDQVPDEVNAQVQWQMFVTGALETDVALLVNGRRFTVYTVPANPDIQQALFEQVSAFWHNNVLANVPPDVVAADNDKLKLLFPKDSGPMLEGDAEAFSLMQGIAVLKAQVKTLEAQQDEDEARLKLAIGAAAGLTFPDGSKATWKANRDSSVTDYKAIAEKYLDGLPVTVRSDILASFTTTKPGARVLRLSIKEPK